MSKGGDGSLCSMGLKRRTVPPFFCLLSAVCCLLVTGCIRRNLTIRSEPPGATVLLNDKQVGTTPYSEGFEWYGWYRVTLLKEDYEQLDDRVLIEAPIYFWIPLDLVMELLPIPIRDEKTLAYQLRPKQELPIPVPPLVDEPASTEATPTTPETPADDQAR